MKQYTLTRSQMLIRLEKMRQAPPVLSIYIRPGMGREDIERTLLQAFDRGDTMDGPADRAAASATGTAVFYGAGLATLVSPPFPVAENSYERSYAPDRLIKMMKHEWKAGLVMVRLGHFAIAVYRGEQLLDYKAGTGLVHARHHKGGSSANRFARHREKQMEYFFTRVEAHAREVLEPRLKELDYIIYGGAQQTLQALWKQCRFFSKLESKMVPRLLNVREPKYSTLPEAIGQAYCSTVYEYET